MKNMGNADRVIRALVAAILAGLAATNVLHGTLATAAWVVASVFLVTSLVGFCPAYRLIGIDTCKRG